MKTQEPKVTFLEHFGSTFSHEAYNLLAENFGAPKVVENVNYIPSSKNVDTLNIICDHKGYGSIPMSTLEEGLVTESLDSFIRLLRKYTRDSECPINVLGSVVMEVHFCLMVRPELTESKIEKIVSHKRGLGACRKAIERIGIPHVEVGSNGEAARLVAEDPAYAKCASLAPQSAAIKYGLKILNEKFEDNPAFTRFFLVGPRERQPETGSINGALLVFRLPHRSGSLYDALYPFKKFGLNMSYIHPLYTELRNDTYDFAIELRITESELRNFDLAMRELNLIVGQCLQFGPFEIIYQ